MPYHVAKSDKCPSAKPWAVIKNSDSSVMGCHPSKAKANKQLQALYASEPSAKADDFKVERLDYCPAERNTVSHPASLRTAVQPQERYRRG